MIITIWQVWTRFEKADTQWYEWVHNHISDGYDPSITSPIPKFENQKGWKSGKWLGIKASLINGKVIPFED